MAGKKPGENQDPTQLDETLPEDVETEDVEEETEDLEETEEEAPPAGKGAKKPRLFTEEEVSGIVRRRINEVHASYSKKLGKFGDSIKAAKKSDNPNSALEAMETELASTRRENVQLMIAMEKGLPASIASAITGDTVEEMEEKADRILADMGKTPTEKRPVPELNPYQGSPAARRDLPGAHLTAEERNVADRFGIPRAEYAAVKKKLGL